MDIKKIILLIIILCAIVIGVSYLYSSNLNHDDTDSTSVNNTTNINSTLNNTNITNNTNNTKTESKQVKSITGSSKNDEPKKGTDDYVKKWDKSEREGSSWSYTHDQPVKKENGHEYKRMYDADTGKSYWYQMDRNYED